MKFIFAGCAGLFTFLACISSNKYSFGWAVGWAVVNGLLTVSETIHDLR